MIIDYFLIKRLLSKNISINHISILQSFHFEIFVVLRSMKTFETRIDKLLKNIDSFACTTFIIGMKPVEQYINGSVIPIWSRMLYDISLLKVILSSIDYGKTAMIKYFVTQVLLGLVRILFGLFIGGFIGVSMGVVVELLTWVEKGGNHPPMEEIMLFTVFGALIGALVGLTNLLSYQDSTKKLPEKDEKKNSF